MKTTSSGTAGIRNSEVAFVVLVFAAYMMLFSLGSLPFRPIEIILIFSLGILYTASGIYLDRLVKSRAQLQLTVGYFCLQIALGAAIIFLGRGGTWLILLPLVGSAVEYLPRAGALLVSGLIWIAQVFPFYFFGGIKTFSNWWTPVLAAVTFVYVFSEITVSEQKARKALVLANQKLREYATQVEELTMVRERNRLAREIHDGLGHYLTAINIQIKAALAMAHQDPGLTSTALNNAQTLTEEALADVRRSITSLREDPTTSRPLPETIERLIAETRSADVQTRLAVEGAPRQLPPQVEFTLYRVVQECLTNVRKHARASQVDLRLEFGQGAVRVCVQDDGQGAEKTSGGFGLVGLRERVELVGGQMRIDTAPGQGFRIEVEIPA